MYLICCLLTFDLVLAPSKTIFRAVYSSALFSSSDNGWGPGCTLSSAHFPRLFSCRTWVMQRKGEFKMRGPILNWMMWKILNNLVWPWSFCLSPRLCPYSCFSVLFHCVITVSLIFKFYFYIFFYWWNWHWLNKVCLQHISWLLFLGGL